MPSSFLFLKSLESELHPMIMTHSPTKRIGASAQWCFISGHHLDVTFSKEEGLTTEKQMRKTSVCGYDSGLRRS